MSGATLERRLANFRASAGTGRPSPAGQPSVELAGQLAAAVDGEIVSAEGASIVRCEPATVILPIDRDRLARLPGHPPADAPLVCLDTETTGLATATGTLAFLVGLGWWDGDRFRQAQLVLPEHPAEPALLSILASHLPPEAWLVTYNGRGFDWPLIVTRYRMAGRDAPRHAGHLDLLPFVRRVFRHRMADARLRSVETTLLGTTRVEDVEGWEIPGRYFDFVRSGEAGPLRDVLRHNREDVRSLARFLAHVDTRYADPAERSLAPRGDLAGLARAFARERRLDEALGCLDAALGAPAPAPGSAARTDAARGAGDAVPQDRLQPGVPDSDDGWWLPTRRPDIGGSPRRSRGWATVLSGRLDSPWTEERIVVERARLLRRLGRFDDAVAAWAGLAAGTGAAAVQALIEIAKLREHRLGDVAGALVATRRAAALAERRRLMGLGDPAVIAAIARRAARLEARTPSRGPVEGRRDHAGANGRRGSMTSASGTGTSRSSGSNEQAIVRSSPARAFR